MSKDHVEIVAFVGLDWADQKHAVTLQEAGSDRRSRLTLDHTPQALDWFGDLHTARACAFLQRWPSLQQLQQATPSSIRKFHKAQGYRGDDKREQLLANIKKAQPLTRDSAVLLSGSMQVETLVQQI